jgi:exopolyphosphatase / guanosine-5'-triphosphate,3'-diphosphate pyrophosphatase
MRLGVLDVGSNTVHLLVVDAHLGAHPLPAYSHKADLHLSEHLEADGSIGPAGVQALTEFVAQALTVAEDQGCEAVLAFATSAIREASNGETVLARVRVDTGVDLQVLGGPDEARLTFLAARRWFGWSSGRLLVLDIGGGSLEVACGLDEEPDVATSLPLGAGRLTRDLLPGDPPAEADVRAARRLVRAEVAKVVRDVAVSGTPDRVVGTSKTLRSLARIAGAPAWSAGPYVPRALARADVSAWLVELSTMTAAERCALPGVSPRRGPQLLAGAMVADAVMDLLDVGELHICPWALREGVILRWLDAFSVSGAPGQARPVAG